MPDASRSRGSLDGRLLAAALLVLVGCLLEALHVQTVLQEERLATHFISPGLWERLVVIDPAPADPAASVPGARSASVSYTTWAIVFVGLSLATWLAGAWLLVRRQTSWIDALARWGLRGWLWWLIPAAWEAVRVTTLLLGWSTLAQLTLAMAPLSQAVMLAGWIATFVELWLSARAPIETAAPLAPQAPLKPAAPGSRRVPWPLVIGMAVYVLVFGLMNSRLYDALLLPHGDSAMYEEHLWNLLHGKGFRSYLDNGRLFLGEHIQVIHLGLIPVYVLWPSHKLLEWCQSLILALGAIPVFWLAARHTGSRAAGILLGLAYLLYVPMQYLDIAIDFKTFRPNSFEIPFILFGLDALERRRLRQFAVWMVLTVLCQEDAAAVLGPLGLWIALRYSHLAGTGNTALAGMRDSALADKPSVAPAAVTPGAGAPGTVSLDSVRAARRRAVWSGLAFTAANGVYLILIIKVILPWFRGGGDVHFASYFSDLGDSSNGIVKNMFLHPGLFIERWLEPQSILMGLALLVPLGGLPLLSPGRAAVALPLAMVLCLNQISRLPEHHFHAPLVPILFWAAAAGLGNLPRVLDWLRTRFKGARGWTERSEGSPGYDLSEPINPPGERGTRVPRVSSEHAAPASARLRRAGDDSPPSLPSSPGAMPPGATGGSSASAGKPTSAQASSGSSGAMLHVAERQRGSVGMLVPPQLPGAHSAPCEKSLAIAGATFAMLCALLCGTISGLSPLSVGFWDPSARAYWRALYVPGERAQKFPEVFALIPPTSRVASTDFVHPRFTHFDRSYDYSSFRPIVPDDTDYIVIDTSHPYSLVDDPKLHRQRPLEPRDVKEYRDEPEKWELVPNNSDGLFIILKRKK